ncbi:MAG: membrane protein insertion efficiency factor YidD [Myxococcota bacterium]|nr:membrane protein insertion efficiency factor YidD [Myxococcota bacterium]
MSIRLWCRWLIRGYQKMISRYTPPSCRFTPSCSNYMLEAIEIHGFVKGSSLGVWRICKCNPFVACGHDPVPPREK